MAGDIAAISRIMIEKTWWVMIFAILLPLLASVCLQKVVIIKPNFDIFLSKDAKVMMQNAERRPNAK